jgi:molybdate transport system permease protein
MRPTFPARTSRRWKPASAACSRPLATRQPDTPAPDPEGGRLIFRWRDPVRIDEVTLLNVATEGARIETFGEGGERLTSRGVPPTGPNGVLAVPLLGGDSAPDEYQSRVHRLEIVLPGGGALAEIRFKWPGRVLQDWQRQRPWLDRLLHNPLTVALRNPAIRYSIRFSLITCTATAILSLWVAVPIGYLLSRYRFWGRNLVDAILDIPIVLPPLVVGLSLLILFQFVPRWLHDAVVFQKPAVVLAQFSVACAFAVRTMRATFDHIDVRREQVALTLGCSRFQAFGLVVVPEAWRGILTAGTLAWARALGEFGPLLIFAGATRNKTEVLSTTVFLEMTVGDLGAAVAVSLIMVVGAVTVLIVARVWGTRDLTL